MSLFNLFGRKHPEQSLEAVLDSMHALKRENAALRKRQAKIDQAIEAQALELQRHQLRFAKVDIVTETNVEFTADLSTEVKNHQRHIAGIFKELAVIKGKL